METVESTRKNKPYGKEHDKSKEKAHTESFLLRWLGSVMALLGWSMIFTVGCAIECIH